MHYHGQITLQHLSITNLTNRVEKVRRFYTLFVTFLEDNDIIFSWQGIL